MRGKGRKRRPEVKDDHQSQGTEQNYSVQVGGKIGLQRISVLAKSDQEAISKLTTIAGDNWVHPETFSKNGAKLPRSRWQSQLGAAEDGRP